MKNFLTVIFALCLFSGVATAGVVTDVGDGVSKTENLNQVQPEVQLSIEVIDLRLADVNLDAIQVTTFKAGEGETVEVNPNLSLTYADYTYKGSRQDKPPHLNLYNYNYNLKDTSKQTTDNFRYLNRMTHSLSC